MSLQRDLGGVFIVFLELQPLCSMISSSRNHQHPCARVKPCLLYIFSLFLACVSSFTVLSSFGKISAINTLRSDASRSAFGLTVRNRIVVDVGTEDVRGSLL